MKWMKVFVAAMILLLPFSVGAWDTRILSLNDPALVQSLGRPAGFTDLVFPTDEFGVGLSAVPDAIDIWKLPQQLANVKLFPSSAIILDWTGSNPLMGNAGLVLPLKGTPLVLGVFLMRPSLNGWVTGTPRSDFGLGASFAASAGNQVSAGGTPPAAPTNLADLFVAAKFGTLLAGLSAGVAYDQAINQTASIVGTANSNTTYTSSSSVITLRGGVGLPVTLKVPFNIDLSVLVLFGNASGSYVSGAAAAVPNVNDTLTAGNMSASFGGRITATLSPALDAVLLAEYALLGQNYAATTAGVALTTTTTPIDPASFGSFAVGTGVNWKPADTLFINALLSAFFGNAAWTAEAPGAGTRPADSIGWTMLRAVIDGEFTIVGPLSLRGGLSGSVRWVTDTRNVDTGGTTSATGFTELGAGASAGIGFKVTDKSTLDATLNLANFLQPGGGLQNLTLQVSLQANLP